MNAPRQRRSAEDARREILDAAERRLVDAGPAALRLQDIAADVGISHPTVLHHFGSREALVQAVVERAIHGLEQDLLRALVASTADTDHGVALLDRVFDTLAARGHARLLAWLILSGHAPLGAAASANWAAIAEVTHAERLRRSSAARPPSFEDTRFTIVLSALALFGQAIAGPPTFVSAGLGDDPSTPTRFRHWLAGVLHAHLLGPGLDTGSAAPPASRTRAKATRRR